jgi:hypothetical protein
MPLPAEAAAAPTVSLVAPSSGPLAGGTSVTITGTAFTGATAVNFGAAPASAFTVNGDTEIAATSPAGAFGPVDVTVTTVDGTSAIGPADTFTYIPPPAVSSAVPTSGPATGGTSVIITGTSFTGATAVNFGTSAASTFTFNSDTQITATSPAGSGPVDVTVTTAGGTSATGSADTFTYVAAPTVSSVAPSSGPAAGGTSVMITGTNFTGAGAVNFGNAAAIFTFNSDTQITAISPAGTGLADVTVTTVGGTSATGAADQFTYIGAPMVSSVAPSSGALAGGTVVTITGANFTGAGAVNFGTAAAATFTFNSDTQITATSPPGSAGAVDVTVTTASATSVIGAADTFTYVTGPTVSSIAPSSGPAAGGTSVIVTGANFTGATAVNFGTSAAAIFTFNSDTQVTATSPVGSGSVDVTVTTAGGTSATGLADTFTYLAASTVSSVAPSSGPAAGGTSVTITGTNFTGASVVNFGATGATFTFDSDTQITATSPAGTGLADVTVTTEGGTSATTSADQFTYVGAPAVSSVAPSSGSLAGGTVVTITGANFTGVTAVNFGSVAAATFTFNSDTQVTATSPAAAGGPVDVTVTTAFGTNATGAGDLFTYMGKPDMVTNVAAVAGNAAIEVTWTAANANGSPILSYEIDSTGGAGLTATVAGDVLKVIFTGLTNGVTYHFVVFANNSVGKSPQSLFSNAVVPAIPTVSSLIPNTGPYNGGTTVKITGTNLSSAMHVFFGSHEATGLIFLRPTAITVISPAGSGTVDVTVVILGGTTAVSLGDKFIYTVTCLKATVVATVAGIPVSSTSIGTPVTFTATPIGCPSPKFVFWLQYPNRTWVLRRNWDPSASWTWLTTGLPAGIYTVHVGANETGYPLTSFQALGPITFLLAGCTNPSLTPDQFSPEPVGTRITFTAAATSCLAPKFEFWLGYPNGTWVMKQSFLSANRNMWAWDTTGLPLGAYKIHVWANKTGDPMVTFESYAEYVFTLTGCASASLLPVTQDLPPGTSVSFTASSTGCIAPALYKYWLGYPNGTWQMLRDWGVADFTWNVNPAAKGHFKVHVWANTTGGSLTKYQAFAESTINLVVCSTATTTLAPSPVNQTAGTTVHFVAGSTGCLSPQFEYWLGYSNGTWQLLRGWGAASFDWITRADGAGTYTVHVWANNTGDPITTYEAYASSAVTLNP